MKQAINVLYGKKVTLDDLNYGVADGNWTKFIKTYCKNISAIDTPKEVRFFFFSKNVFFKTIC